MAELMVPISPGELIDKITILEIKSARMTDAAKLHNVRTELTLLNDTWRASASATATTGTAPIYTTLGTSCPNPICPLIHGCSTPR